METTETIIKLISAGVLLIAYTIIAIANTMQYRKLRRELGEVKIIVKDTNEIREALQKPFEGTWAISGEFSTYKGKHTKHYTTGTSVFTWNPKGSRYDVIYMYSVRAEKEKEDVITCFSSGRALSDTNGSLENNGTLELNLKIDSRTSRPDYGNEITRGFVMVSKPINKPDHGPVNKLIFEYNTHETNGLIIFTK